jgi:uncharacterized protein (DUF952 family)
MKTILHITNLADWKTAQQRGVYEAPSLANEGFIHCSTAAQTAETATRFYRGQQDLVLLVINEARVEADIRYEAPAEPAAGPGQKESAARDDTAQGFPHIYGPLNLDAVVGEHALVPKGDGSFELPVLAT